MSGRHATTGRPIAETIATYVRLRAHGMSVKEIAAELGIQSRSLRRAIQRARKAGLL